MFDQVVVRPRVKVVKSVLVVGSAVAHAAVVAGLMVAAMWHIERVPVGAFAADLTFSNTLPQGAAELPAGKPQLVVKPHLTRIKEVTQPTIIPPDQIQPSGPVGGPDIGSTLGGGDGPHCRLAADPASDLPLCATDLPPCAEPPCSTDGDPPEVIKPPVIAPVLIVPPTVAKGLRVAGDEQIFPSRVTQLAMIDDGKTTVHGTFQLCVDAAGAISSVRRLASTGYNAYDAALQDAMRGWRYRPYQLESPSGSGHMIPAPMCTVQMFVYRIKP